MTDASAAGHLAFDDMNHLHRTLRELLPTLAALAGLDPASIDRTLTRDWSPVDGAVPPNCPYSETTLRTASAGETTLSLQFEAAHWSEDDCARTSLTLSLAGAGERDYRVSAWSPAAGRPTWWRRSMFRGWCRGSWRMCLASNSAPPDWWALGCGTIGLCEKSDALSALHTMKTLTPRIST